MNLKSRVTRLEEKSPETKQPIFVFPQAGETQAEAKARVFEQQGIADDGTAHVIYVMWGKEDTA